MDWTEFDNMLSDDLMKELETLEAGNGEKVYKEVPFGKYEVVPELIEFGSSKKNKPQTHIRFRIVNGEYKRSLLFAYFGMATAFGIHNVKSLIRKLEPSCEVKFENFSQWNVMLKGVAEEICGQASYVLEYSENVDNSGNAWKNFEIESGPYEVPLDYVRPKPKTEGQ